MNYGNNRTGWIFILIFLAAAFIPAFFGGCSQKNQSEARNPKSEISYWTCGMHPSVKVSPDEYRKGSTKCPVCGMDLVPVYAEKSEKEMQGMSGEHKAKILYYTDAMHPSVRVSEEEYKNGTTQCPICNMDLYPVYEDASGVKKTAAAGGVKIDKKEAALAGIATIEADFRNLTKEIVTVGKIAYDPDLVVAEEEYLTTLETYEKISGSHITGSAARTKRLLEESEYKLKLLGLNDSLIKELKAARKAHTNLILPEDKVWVYAEVYELDIGAVKTGQEVKVEATAYPGEIFTGKIKAIDSVLNPMTRSSRVRAEISNPGLRLKPDMFVSVKILSRIGNVLSVPRDAVLNTGVRSVVYVDAGESGYVLREIETGAEGIAVVSGVRDRFYRIRKGLEKGEKVVIRANFLIDSQSQLVGPAAAAYGGALGKKGKKKMPPGHMRH